MKLSILAGQVEVVRHSIHLFRFVRLRSMRANNGIQIDFLFLVLMAKQKNKKNCGQQSNYRY